MEKRPRRFSILTFIWVFGYFDIWQIFVVISDAALLRSSLGGMILFGYTNGVIVR